MTQAWPSKATVAGLGSMWLRPGLWRSFVGSFWAAAAAQLAGWGLELAGPDCPGPHRGRAAWE